MEKGEENVMIVEGPIFKGSGGKGGGRHAPKEICQKEFFFSLNSHITLI